MAVCVMSHKAVHSCGDERRFGVCALASGSRRVMALSEVLPHVIHALEGLFHETREAVVAANIGKLLLGKDEESGCWGCCSLVLVFHVLGDGDNECALHILQVFYFLCVHFRAVKDVHMTFFQQMVRLARRPLVFLRGLVFLLIPLFVPFGVTHCSCVCDRYRIAARVISIEQSKNWFDSETARQKGLTLMSHNILHRAVATNTTGLPEIIVLWSNN